MTRRSRKLEEAVEKLSDELEDELDDDDSNYACKTCGTSTHLDDHQREAVGWCNDCDRIRVHERLDR